MRLKKFGPKKPNTAPPQPDGWNGHWHGYFQMKKVLSEKTRVRYAKQKVKSDVPTDALGAGELERQLFLNIIHNIKKDHINMFELGAGRGDWCLSLAGVVDFNLIPSQAKTYRCLALEAEPTHCRWIQEHFVYQHINGIVVHGAVQAYNGTCKFDASVDPADSYGQGVSERGNIVVPCYTVDRLMQEYSFDNVDIVHMDVQGAEYDAVLSACQAIDTGDIDYWLIGTHRPKQELNKKIRELLKAKYNCVIDIGSRAGVVETPLGMVSVPVDGLMLFQREGIADCEEIVALDPHTAQICQMAQDKFNQDRPSEALELLEQVKREAQSENIVVTGVESLRAACLVKLQRLDEAASAAKSELRIQPGNNSAERILEVIGKFQGKTLERMKHTDCKV